MLQHPKEKCKAYTYKIINTYMHLITEVAIQTVFIHFIQIF